MDPTTTMHRHRPRAGSLIATLVAVAALGACGGESSTASAPEGSAPTSGGPTTSTAPLPEPEPDTGNDGPGSGQPSFVPPTTSVPVDLGPALLDGLPDLDLPGIDTAFDPRTCEVEVTMSSETIGFAHDSDAIPSDGPGHAALVAVAELLAGAEEATVVGHSSSEGNPEYNRDLSRRRAASARAVLAPRMPGTRLVVRGAGSDEPKVPEDGSEATRAPNRRVVISGQITSDEHCPPDEATG